MCVDNVQENTNAILSCPAGETISQVKFAAYGMPTGTCTGQNFSINTTCNAANTLAVVSKLCVGNSTCTVDVNTKALNPQPHGGDPCGGVKKHFSAEVVCKSTGHGQPALRFTYTVTVPAGAQADVVLATFGAKASDSGLSIREGGKSVWANGKYVSGIDGITGAIAGADLSGEHITVAVGSGQYVFTVFS
jgi:hypothetical protein